MQEEKNTGYTYEDKKKFYDAVKMIVVIVCLIALVLSDVPLSVIIKFSVLWFSGICWILYMQNEEIIKKIDEEKKETRLILIKVMNMIRTNEEAVNDYLELRHVIS